MIIQVYFQDGTMREFLNVQKYEIADIGGITFIRITFENNNKAHILADIIKYIGSKDDFAGSKPPKKTKEGVKKNEDSSTI